MHDYTHPYKRTLNLFFNNTTITTTTQKTEKEKHVILLLVTNAVKTKIHMDKFIQANDVWE